MEIDEKLIKEFVKKQDITEDDQWMQARVIEEEAREVRDAVLGSRIRDIQEEIADVIISALVFADSNGWLNELPAIIADKMKINLEKPTGRNPGEKVRK